MFCFCIIFLIELTEMVTNIQGETFTHRKSIFEGDLKQFENMPEKNTDKNTHEYDQ